MLLARDNPFRMQRIEALRYRLDEDGWQQVLSRFAAHRWRGVLVGPHGSGKTTLREEIEARLRAEGWQVRVLVLGDGEVISWSDVQALLVGAHGRTLLSVDGLDRLSALTWWRLRRATRAIGGILATSHVSGRLPTLHHHHTSVALLRDLLVDLLRDRRDDAVVPADFDQRCEALFHAHHGDLRACLRSCYDAAARLESLPLTR